MSRIVAMLFFQMLILFFLSFTINAQTNAISDSTILPDSITKLPARTTLVEKKVDTIQKKVSTPVNEPCNAGCKGEMDVMKWIMVLIPLILFLAIGTILTHLILKNHFELSEALSTTTVTETKAVSGTKSLDGAETPAYTSSTTKPVGSTSRLIAFFTGLTAIIIAICLLSYYAYFTIAECNGNPKFDQMWTILLGLGIGVIPYGVNVWRGNQKESKTPNDHTTTKPQQ